MLHGKEREQANIDRETDPERPGRGTVEGRRNPKIADKCNRIQKRCEENQITKNSISKEDNSF
jgi:hypothetical protein